MVKNYGIVIKFLDYIINRSFETTPKPLVSSKQPDRWKEIETEQAKKIELETPLNKNCLKQDDKKEFVEMVKPQFNKHKLYVKSKQSFQVEKSKPFEVMKMEANKPKVPCKPSTLNQPDKEKRVEIVKADANEHGVPLKPTNLKSFFDKLEAKSNEEDPAAIRAVSSIKKF